MNFEIIPSDVYESILNKINFSKYKKLLFVNFSIDYNKIKKFANKNKENDMKINLINIYCICIRIRDIGGCTIVMK